MKGHTAVHCCNFSKSGRLMGTGSSLAAVFRGGRGGRDNFFMGKPCLLVWVGLGG